MTKDGHHRASQTFATVIQRSDDAIIDERAIGFRSISARRYLTFIGSYSYGGDHPVAMDLHGIALGQ